MAPGNRKLVGELMLACLSLILILIALLPLPSLAQGQTSPIARESYFEFPAITTLDGRVLPASYWRGKVVIIQRWASWCPFCARQNPYLNELQLKFKAQGLEVLAVSVDAKATTAYDYIVNKGFQFNVAMMTPELRSKLGKTRMLPEIWVIGKDGRFKEYIPGEMFPEDIEALSHWLSK
jgi:thiol-disulfide isomerase/thioredoxin